jgi:hypothetical protein
MRALASGTELVTEAVVCELHRRIVLRSEPAIAGVWSRLPRRIPHDVQRLMHRRLDETWSDYLAAVREATDPLT